MIVKIYKNIFETHEPVVIETDNLSEWLLSYYGETPSTPIDLYEGNPAYGRCITGEIDSVLNACLGEYTVIERPAEPTSAAMFLQYFLIVVAVANAAMGPDSQAMPQNVNRNQASQNNQLGNRSNTNRVFQRIEDIYGSVLAIPSEIAPTYQYYGGNNKYERGTYCIGRGYYDTTDLQNTLKDGETRLDYIPGTKVSVYKPFTFPVRDTPQIDIGAGIHTVPDIRIRSKSVDGIDLLAPNEITIDATKGWLFYDDKMYYGDQNVDISGIFTIGDTIIVEQAVDYGVYTEPINGGKIVSGDIVDNPVWSSTRIGLTGSGVDYICYYKFTTQTGVVCPITGIYNLKGTYTSNGTAITIAKTTTSSHNTTFVIGWIAPTENDPGGDIVKATNCIIPGTDVLRVGNILRGYFENYTGSSGGTMYLTPPRDGGASSVVYSGNPTDSTLITHAYRGKILNIVDNGSTYTLTMDEPIPFTSSSKNFYFGVYGNYAGTYVVKDVVNEAYPVTIYGTAPDGDGGDSLPVSSYSHWAVQIVTSESLPSPFDIHYICGSTFKNWWAYMSSLGYNKPDIRGTYSFFDMNNCFFLSANATNSPIRIVQIGGSPASATYTQQRFGKAVVSDSTHSSDGWSQWVFLPNTLQSKIQWNFAAKQGLYKVSATDTLRVPAGYTVDVSVVYEVLNPNHVSSPTLLVETAIEHTVHLKGYSDNPSGVTYETPYLYYTTTPMSLGVPTGPSEQHVYVGPVRTKTKRLTNRDFTYNGNVVDGVQWEDCYSVIPLPSTFTSGESPRNFGNITWIQTETKLNQNSLHIEARQLNCLASRLLPTYNGSTWSATLDSDGKLSSGTLNKTKSPVDIIAAIIQDKRIGYRPLSEMDLDQIYATVERIKTWNTNCAEFSYTFDSDSISLEDHLSIISDAIFCKEYRQNNKIRLAFDYAQTTSTALITHRSKKPGNADTITRRFFDDGDYDAVQVIYPDPDTLKTETFYLPLNYNFVRARKIEIPGIRNFTQAYLRGWREYQRMFNQRVGIKLEMTKEARLLVPNARVDIQDNTRFKTYGGEVLGYNYSSRIITLSDEVIFVDGKTHTLTLIQRNGSVDSIPCYPTGSFKWEIGVNMETEATYPQFYPWINSQYWMTLWDVPVSKSKISSATARAATYYPNWWKRSDIDDFANLGAHYARIVKNAEVDIKNDVIDVVRRKILRIPSIGENTPYEFLVSDAGFWLNITENVSLNLVSIRRVHVGNTVKDFVEVFDLENPVHTLHIRKSGGSSSFTEITLTGKGYCRGSILGDIQGLYEYSLRVSGVQVETGNLTLGGFKTEVSSFPGFVSVPVLGIPTGFSISFPAFSVRFGTSTVSVSSFDLTVDASKILDVWVDSSGSVSSNYVPLDDYTNAPRYENKMFVARIQTGTSKIDSISLRGDMSNVEESLTYRNYVLDNFKKDMIVEASNKVWSPSTSFTVNDVLKTSLGFLFRVLVSGISSTTEPGVPDYNSGSNVNVFTDGTVTLTYIGHESYIGAWKQSRLGGMRWYFSHIAAGLLPERLGSEIKAYVKLCINRLMRNWVSGRVVAKGCLVGGSVTQGRLWECVTGGTTYSNSFVDTAIVGTVVTEAGGVQWKMIGLCPWNAEWSQIDSNPEMTASRPPDSHDSYAALLIWVVANYVDKTLDTDWLLTSSDHYGYTYLSVLKEVIYYNLLTQFDKGLTRTFQNDQNPAGGTYAARYLMDNCEVWQGLDSTLRLFTRMGDLNYVSYVKAFRDNNLQAINDLWQDNSGGQGDQVVLARHPLETPVVVGGIDGIRTVYGFTVDDARPAMAYRIQTINYDDPTYCSVEAVNYSEADYTYDTLAVPTRASVVGI